MKVSELLNLLGQIHSENVAVDPEVRIGDQIEAGPYSHARVVGIYRGLDGDVIICGDDDWQEEEPAIDTDLEVIWKPEN